MGVKKGENLSSHGSSFSGRLSSPHHGIGALLCTEELWALKRQKYPGLQVWLRGSFLSFGRERVGWEQEGFRGRKLN